MYKAIILAAIACCLVVTNAAPASDIHDIIQVREDMNNAYNRGFSKFSSPPKVDNYATYPISANKSRILSHYTKGLTALGGGKPRLTDQYRAHNYVPLPPSIVPREFTVSEPMTPKETAAIVKPHGPLQYTSDHLW